MKIKNKLKMSIKGLIGAMFLSGIFLGSPLTSFAGSPVEASSEEGWTLIAEKGDVKAYAQIVTCGSDEQSMYLIKLVNTSKSENLTVEYSIDVTNSSTAGAWVETTDVMKNSSVEGTCEGLNPTMRAYMTNPEDDLKSLVIIIKTIKITDYEK